MGKSAAKLSQFGLLGLILFAVGAQGPEPSLRGQAAGLFSVPTGAFHTTTEGAAPVLLSGSSRVKSIPKPDWPFALAATAGVPVRPASSDLLPAGGAAGLYCAHPYAHSGRAPPPV